MLIASFYQTTGSFFHQSGKDQGEKISQNARTLIRTGIVETTVITGIVATFALAAFANIDPFNLSSIPLSIKATIIVGGVALLLIDNGYAYYRLKKTEKELPLMVEEEIKEALSVQVESEEEYAERMQASSNRIAELDAIIEKLQSKIIRTSELECEYIMNNNDSQAEATKQNIKVLKSLLNGALTLRKQEQERAKQNMQDQEENKANIADIIQRLMQLKKAVS